MHIAFPRYFMAVVFMLFGLSLYAQKTEYGIFGGYQQTTARYSVRNIEQETGNKHGAFGGLIIRIPFEAPLYFTPSFFYSHKGYTVDLKDTSMLPGVDAISNDVSVHSFDIAPLFNIDLSRKPTHAFIQLGPSMEFIFYGYEKLGLKNGTTRQRPMNFSFTDYGRITASAIGRIGMEFKKGLFFFGQYSYGLGNASNADGGPQINHGNFGFSIGKYFRRSDPNAIDSRNSQ